MIKAIVVGSEGQDGRIMFDRLVRDGCDVFGIGRGVARRSDSTQVHAVDIADRAAVLDVIEDVRPDEIYYLPAVHQPAEGPKAPDDAALFDRSFSVHVTGLIHFLDAIKTMTGRSPGSKTRLFYAASSLVFGDVTDEVQDEMTAMNPRCIYGITKLAGIQCCRFYRRMYDVHASSGSLYNHESPLRGKNFVSQKIIRGAHEIARGERDQLVLGDLSARIDWGYAPDFVDAMIRIVRHVKGDDYIVATGKAHRVLDFVRIVFDMLELDWTKHVVEDRTLLLRNSVTRIGNATKLRALGWSPSLTFEEMVRTLTENTHIR